MADQVKEIASRIRELREIEGQTTQDMAKALGVSVETYAGYENGNADVPISCLARLADCLNVDLAELVTGKAPRLKTYKLTRAGAGAAVERRTPYRYRALALNFVHAAAEPFMVEVDADSEKRPLELNAHPGQEFNYVVEGKLLISVGGHELELNEGDSLYFDSKEPHGMKALGGKGARFLAIII